MAGLSGFGAVAMDLRTGVGRRDFEQRADEIDRGLHGQIGRESSCSDRE
jgi:hypothetical protein